MKSGLKLILLFLLFIHFSQAQNPLEIKSNFLASDLAGHLNIFEDSLNKFKIGNLKFDDFKLYNKKTPKFGHSNSNFWFKIDCNSISPKTIDLILDIDLVYAENISFYTLSENKTINKFENISWRTDIKDKPIESRYFAFPIALKPYQKLSIIFSIKESEGILVAPITLFSNKVYYKQYSEYDLSYFITIAITLIFCTATLFLFIIQRKKILFYYFLYQFGFLIYSLNVEGVLSSYFPSIFKYNVWYSFGIYLSIIGNILFANEFILKKCSGNQTKYAKWLVYLFFCFCMIWLLLLAFLQFSSKIAFYTSAITSLSFILIFYISVIGILQKIENSHLYFIAILPVTISSILLRLFVFNVFESFGDLFENEFFYLLNYYAPVFEVVILGIGLINFLSKEKEHNILKISGLQADLIQTQEAERTRIAQDLHDDLGGTLSALKGSISSEKEELLINKAMADLRNISRDLAPPEFEKQGLVTTLKSYVTTIQANTSIQFSLIVFGEVHNFPLEKELNIYRIISELVNNIIRHSHAETAMIQLVYHADYLFVSVEDDGKSEKSQSKPLGIGLKSINSRIEYLGARKISDNTTYSCIFELPYTS